MEGCSHKALCFLTFFCYMLYLCSYVLLINLINHALLTELNENINYNSYISVHCKNVSVVSILHALILFYAHITCLLCLDA